jgi:hypothetical protein
MLYSEAQKRPSQTKGLMTMNYKAINIWLDERGIRLEEDFVSALIGYAKAHKKKFSNDG